MSRLRFPGTGDEAAGNWEPIPFPGPKPPQARRRAPAGLRRGAAAPPGHDVLQAFDQVSRRMEDLARALGCLGFFNDDDDDRPTAA